MSTAKEYYDQIRDDFAKRTTAHAMTVELDQGVHRSIRFAKPGTSIESFRITTFPWHLVYSGDMGSFVFNRNEDMVHFFDTVDLGYLAQKVEAVDKCDGLKEFSGKDSTKCLLDNLDPDDEEHAACIEKIRAEIGEPETAEEWIQSIEFLDEQYRDIIGQDFHESMCYRYTFRFVWACYAIQWGLKKYKASLKAEACEVVNA